MNTVDGDGRSALVWGKAGKITRRYLRKNDCTNVSNRDASKRYDNNMGYFKLAVFTACAARRRRIESAASLRIANIKDVRRVHAGALWLVRMWVVGDGGRGCG